MTYAIFRILTERMTGHFALRKWMGSTSSQSHAQRTLRSIFRPAASILIIVASCMAIDDAAVSYG